MSTLATHIAQIEIMCSLEAFDDVLNSQSTFPVNIDIFHCKTLARIVRTWYVLKHDGFEDMAEDVQDGNRNSDNALI